MNYTFIIGCARSGTSILGELVASHPEVKYIFEASRIWELAGMGENDSHRLTEKNATEPIKGQIRQWFELQADTAQIIVEKNPRNSLRVPYVKAIFPEAKFIHIIRDGRDVACSMIPGCGGKEWLHLKPVSWQAYHQKYSGAIRCAYVWKDTVEMALEDLRSMQYLQIRYEDLLTSPATIAKSIFDFLGMSLHPNTLNFCSKISDNTSSPYHAKIQSQWYRNNHSTRIGRWYEELNNEEKEEINLLLTPLLTQLGYSTESTYPEKNIFSRNNGALSMPNNRMIVVLGMHRSGTSAVTRGLQVLGVELGDNLMPPGVGDNDKGYWEDIDLNVLNLDILQSLNSNWHSLKPLQPAEVEALTEKGYLQQAIDLLYKKTSNIKIFGFKNPRVAKLLPFWKRVFSKSGLDVSYVIVVRHPLSVGQSLAKRDGFDLEKSTLLWLDHVINSLYSTLDETRVLVDYDRLIQSPETELQKIADALQLQIDPSALEKFKDEFLDARLRHTFYGPESLIRAADVSPLVKEVYAMLVDIENNKTSWEDTKFKDKVSYWRNEYTRLTTIFIYIDRLTSTIDSLTARNVELDAQVQTLTKQINEIVTSKAWKVAVFLRQIRLWLLPPHN